MSTLSVVLIVKNESENLADCLKSTQTIADEIIIVDAGSTDNTLEIAKQYTNKIYIHNDWQGFGKQRQIAQHYATKDWVLMLDADERLTTELFHEIRDKIQDNNQDCIYSLPRLSYAFGDFIRFGGWYPDFVMRLYPRIKTQYNVALVHEKLAVPDNLSVIKLKGDLLHYTYRDLEHYLVKSAQYSTAWAKQRQIKNKKSSIFQGIGHGVFYFIKMYLLRLGFLDGRQGLLLALLSAHSVFAKYANLWVMNQSDKNTE